MNGGLVLTSSVPYSPNKDLKMNPDPLKSDLGDLITPDPNSTADKSSVCVRSQPLTHHSLLQYRRSYKNVS